MFLTLQESDNSILFIGDILDYALNSFLSIPVEYFEFASEIIEGKGIGSFAFGSDKFDSIFAAIIINGNEVIVVMNSTNHHLVLFELILLFQFGNIHFGTIDSHISVEVLQFVETGVKSTFPNVILR